MYVTEALCSTDIFLKWWKIYPEVTKVVPLSQQNLPEMGYAIFESDISKILQLLKSTHLSIDNY